jgi:DNA helicase-2/ATP-dependent DNA helicase PcrA
LVAQRPSGPAPEYLDCPDDAAEAEDVAITAAGLIAKGVPAHEIAILFRTNSQSEPFEYALSSAGVPYQVRGAQRFFSRPEVKRAVALLRSEARAPSDADTLTRIGDALGAAGWTEHAPPGRGQRREQWESLDALARLCRQMYEAGAVTMDAIAALVLDRQAHDHAPAGAGVTLASLHAAKGLEWDAVFLVGLSDGLMPISLAETAEQVAEERRLLYVGVTRAREHLTLSYAAARTEGGAANRKPTRFLAHLWPEADDDGPYAPRTPFRFGGGRPPVVRAPAKELTARQTETHQRLLKWRATAAQAASIPAYAVLPDVTLRALAVAHPESTRELAAVRGIGPVKIARYGDAILAELGPRR